MGSQGKGSQPPPSALGEHSSLLIIPGYLFQELADICLGTEFLPRCPGHSVRVPVALKNQKPCCFSLMLFFVRIWSNIESAGWGSQENESLALGDCCQLQGTELLELWLAHNVPCKLTAVAALLDSLEMGAPRSILYPKCLGPRHVGSFGILRMFAYTYRNSLRWNPGLSMKLICLTRLSVTSHGIGSSPVE